MTLATTTLDDLTRESASEETKTIANDILLILQTTTFERASFAICAAMSVFITQSNRNIDDDTPERFMAGLNAMMHGVMHYRQVAVVKEVARN